MLSRLFRLIYGILLAALLFTPFGVYHSTSEPYIQGNLFGYNLPVGYVGVILGILVIASPKLGFLKNRNFGSLMVLIGLLLFVSFAFSPKGFFINLIHGTNFDSFRIDVDYPSGNALAVLLSCISVAVGCALWVGDRVVIFASNLIKPKKPFNFF